ncbi:hypothetical protein STIUS_v1c00320 [Spiroplasma sp. TIUS-1]|uniref:APC family permease n=1 Tax=Spiroplasma sp. TIUS-1 TaxID=216963 RepID=UPI00139746DD|nr:APC family permease [Spiroplasma sp. TIUS-1]QHX35587.1 hypothetical protein STIUS_v1c00320 [Spiroplasma sp. TIUS-1]
MKTKKESNQIGVWNGVWMLFSMIAGITFIMNFGAFNGEGENNSGNHIGFHIIWIIALLAVVVLATAWAFIKLLKIHPTANGGGAQYVRTAFGKFAGLIYSACSIFVISLLFMSMIVSIRQSFIETTIGDKYIFNFLNNWSTLFYDVFGIILATCAALVAFNGVNKLKKVSTLIAYLSWFITALIAIGALIIIFGGSYSERGPIKSEINYSSFQVAFLALFFSFGGFETFINTGRAIKNRDKNLPKIIFISIILSAVFFITFSLLILFSLVSEFGGTPNMEIFKRIDKNLAIGFGIPIILFYMIINRFNSLTQIAFYGSNATEPLVAQKYLPKKLGTLNDKNIARYCLVGLLILNLAFSFVFLVIPDIIQGATGKPSPFDFTSIVQITSLFFVLMYGLVVSAAIFHGIKKNIKVRIVEYIIWAIVVMLLLFVLGNYCKDVFGVFFDKNANIQKIYSSVIQIVTFISILTLCLILHFVYNKKAIDKLSSEELIEFEKYENNIYRVISAEEKQQHALIEETT